LRSLPKNFKIFVTEKEKLMATLQESTISATGFLKAIKRS
jgi:hypothetical protein